MPKEMEKIYKYLTNTKTITGVIAVVFFCIYQLLSSIINKKGTTDSNMSIICFIILIMVVGGYVTLIFTHKSTSEIKNQGRNNRFNQGTKSNNKIDSKGDDNQFFQG